MTHSHTRIWVHLIWATKNRDRVLFKEPGKQLFTFLIDKAKELNAPFESLNIQPEHIHGLIDLPTNVCVADFMKGIKGASSYWINQEGIIRAKFSWQRGYGAYSVSSSQLQTIKNYIKNQDEHHQQKTFEEEYQEWKRQYGIHED